MSDARQRDTLPPLCDYEGSTYRTDFWEGQGREYEDAVERIALRRLLPPRGTRLVDIGAGFGRLADMYAGYEQVVLLDFSRSQLEYARERLGDERFIYVAADTYRLPLATHAVDVAVTVRTLHHIADIPRAFRNIERAIRPQGHYVLEFANKRHLKNIARYLLKRQPNPFDRQPYEFAELHYDYHPAWMEERLREVGAHVERRLSVSLFRSHVLKRNLPTPLLVSIDSALQSIGARLALAPSVFLRARIDKPGAEHVVDTGSLFRCPSCGHEPLVRVGDAMICQSCDARWPIENGIYVFK